MNRILVVDDNPLVADVLRDTLTEASYEVAIALDANQGYATAITFQPDLILMDVHLPDLLGFDLVNIIKQRDDLKHTPIIMITGSHMDTQYKVRAFKSGVDDYVTKPFEMPELLERIAAILRRTQSHSPSVAPPIESPLLVNAPNVVLPPRAEAVAPEPAPVRVALPTQQTLSPKPVSDAFLDPEADRPSPTNVLPGVVHAASPPIIDKAEDGAALAPEREPVIPIATKLKDALKQLGLRPGSLSANQPFPAVALLFVLAANGLVLMGLLAAAGPGIKPMAVLLSINCIWGLAVAWIVMTSSLLGIPLGWKDGARLFSLAAIPLLFRLLGGCILAVVTTLSPFLFSAGPALFAKNPSGFLEGLDVCVLVTVILCGRFLKAREEHSSKAWIVAAGLWLMFMVVGIIARKFA